LAVFILLFECFGFGFELNEFFLSFLFVDKSWIWFFLFGLDSFSFLFVFGVGVGAGVGFGFVFVFVLFLDFVFISLLVIVGFFLFDTRIWIVLFSLLLKLRPDNSSCSYSCYSTRSWYVIRWRIEST
jgi:hypothetical protein